MTTTAATRTCRKCHVSQDIEEFYWDGRGTGRRVWSCKQCRRDEQRERNRRHAKRDPNYWRDRSLRHVYGITLADFDAMLARQGGVCAICGTDRPRGRAGRLHVDHCHDTGRVRGLLCHACNTGLGHFGDSLERLRAATTYLTTNKENA